MIYITSKRKLLREGQKFEQKLICDFEDNINRILCFKTEKEKKEKISVIKKEKENTVTSNFC